jgi:hypothetical protein
MQIEAQRPDSVSLYRCAIDAPHRSSVIAPLAIIVAALYCA